MPGGASVNPPNITIRIIDVPPGEAPHWVREKWVGLELSVVGNSDRRRVFGFGVLSQPRSRWMQWLLVLFGRAEVVDGYIIEAAPAVDLLSRSAPEAAEWWRENAAQAIAPRRCFVFHAHVCRVV